jgi:hypothetical protein
MAKKTTRLRVPVPPSEIDNHLERQLRLLEKSCIAYDEGDRDEFTRIATAIRVIVYDQGQSRSLLGQLDMKNAPFTSFAHPISGHNMMADTAVTMVRMGPGSDVAVLPVLDQGAFGARTLSFDTWWSEPIIRLPDDERLTRGQLVLITANQSGGAHVDPEIDAVFHRVASLNEAGWSISSSSGRTVELGDVEKASLRHIGFEVTLAVRQALSKRSGNKPCACGSGRKHRYCHGKPANGSAG